MPVSLSSGRSLARLGLSAALAFGLPSLSGSALACGGFFCNANLPVNQSAERVVFARVDGQIHMHVQINYQGPPSSFGWLLPTSPQVETAISSEAFFSALDRIYGPRFELEYRYDDGCGLDFAEEQAAGGPPPAPEPSVQVLSREAIGPYDRAILLPESVEALRGWLDENGYQIPSDLDEKLQPYVELRAAFVAIKLLPGLESGDIVPLRLSFPGDRPSIPIIPTSVAADPDMGVIVHVFDEARAVPVNYSHVIINEAAIDWLNQGSNYADVVSQAADEAGGRAFVTDYAGEIGEQLSTVLSPYPEELLNQIAEATSLPLLMNLFDDRTNPDLHRVLANYVEVPEGVEPGSFFRCVSCTPEGEQPVDGAQVAAALRAEINEVYEQLNAVIDQTSYVTRLYSTLSADEMDRDPSFSINPDLEPVSNVHTASAQVSCGGDPYMEEVTITLADGRSFRADEATPISRQDGETVRGQDVPAAAVIEQMFEAGQPEVMMERVPDEMTPGMSGSEPDPDSAPEASEPMTAEEAEDKGCQQGELHPTVFMLLLMILASLASRAKLVRAPLTEEE